MDVDILYGAYPNSEPETLRLRVLNAALRAEIAKTRAEIVALREENARLKEENQKVNARPDSNISQLSPLHKGFMAYLLNGADAGGIDTANFWPRYRLQRATWQNDRYKFYVAYLFERKGWRSWHGKEKRTIFSKGRKIIVVHTEDTMPVSHNAVYALIGRAFECKICNMGFDVSALCVTSETLSEKARRIARSFNVSFEDGFRFQNFPYVKCKVLQDGTRKFYTPINDCYITSQVIPSKGDIFCRTANDAARLGFQPL